MHSPAKSAFFANLSIRGKLVVIIVASTLLSLAAGFAMTISTGVRDLKRDLIETTETVARAAGQYSAVGLAFDDRQEAEGALNSLRVFEIVELAVLYDLDRRPFVVYAREGVAAAPPPFEDGAATAIRGDAVHSWNPVVFEDKRYGSIYVRASTEQLSERIRVYLYRMLGLGVALLGFSLFFALLLQRFISRPLVDLAAVAARISRDNDYSLRVQKKGNDEIGALYDGFNAMLGQIDKRQKELERSNRDLDQFAYVASHDLKAPLRAISTLAGWLEEDLGERLAPDEREQLQLLRGRVKRMDSLVEGILQYSRVGRLEGQYEKVDLGLLVHEVLDDLGPPPGLTVESDQSWPTLEIRRLRLKQVLSNLITNAVKYHDKKGRGGWIRISGRLHEPGEGPESAPGAGALELAVADNGPGIARDHHHKIFQIFQTLQPRDKVESTGLGLALVAKLVEDEGGKVWVESEPGQGCVFKVRWPAGQAAVAGGEITKNHPPTGSIRGRTE
jgi:signal transduction histidine kinase